MEKSTSDLTKEEFIRTCEKYGIYFPYNMKWRCVITMSRFTTPVGMSKSDEIEYIKNNVLNLAGYSREDFVSPDYIIVTPEKYLKLLKKYYGEKD